MHIIDLKYGKGVPVSPVGNSQLMLYALGAYNSYGDIYNIETVTMHIVQPRVDNTDSYSMVLSDLLAWGEGVKVIAKKHITAVMSLILVITVGFARLRVGVLKGQGKCLRLSRS